MFSELIHYCRKKENETEKSEMEKRLFPLWLVSFALSKIGEVFPSAEIMEIQPYDEFINSVLNADEKEKTVNREKTPDEIMREFLPIIKKDKGG